MLPQPGSWKSAHLRFFHTPLLSLTPCFSWVLPADPMGVNRFNGFGGTDFRTCARLQIRIGALKPLKRLTVAPSLLNTQLKQGVNEMGREFQHSSTPTLQHSVF